MIQRILPAVLSIVAIIVSGLALAGSREAPPAAAAVVPLRATPSPAAPVDPDLVGNCGSPAPATSLKTLMLGHMNASMTKVSFALHHDDGDLGERLNTVASCSVQIIDAVRASPGFLPEVPIDQLPEYFRQLDALESHALAMKVAALEGDEASTLHWFSHLKQSCIGCHSRFRTNEP